MSPFLSRKLLLLSSRHSCAIREHGKLLGKLPSQRSSTIGSSSAMLPAQLFRWRMQSSTAGYFIFFANIFKALYRNIYAHIIRARALF
jgi:hypothetical protein